MVQNVARVARTGAARRIPPPLEQFDPLNPGEWQLGAGGKLLPRLPEGTRVGKLVMGKYGLYDPKLRKRVEAYSVSSIFYIKFCLCFDFLNFSIMDHADKIYWCANKNN